MNGKRFLWALCLVFVPLLASADYLEVRRNAYIYEEASRHSAKLQHIQLKEGEGPYLLQPVDDTRKNGYYKVRLRGQTREGWIYKSLVRRYEDQHPGYVPYKRALYRHWIDEDRDCQNTRAEVLIRSAKDQNVEFRTDKGCVVARGTWVGPYTGKTFRDAKQLDVDHVVPLKNAHESGAWAWSPAKRRRYANYLDHNKHLLAVSASENRRKGAKGPDQYLSPLKSYHCEYVRIWAKIKVDWELEMTEAEGEKVQTILDGCS